MRKKPIDTTIIANELAEASVYFAPPKKLVVKQRRERISKLKNERSNVPTNERTNEASEDQEFVRVKIRHTFDIYEDQLRELQAQQLEAVQSGNRKPKLGAMVQEAIEDYLAKRK